MPVDETVTASAARFDLEQQSVTISLPRVTLAEIPIELIIKSPSSELDHYLRWQLAFAKPKRGRPLKVELEMCDAGTAFTWPGDWPLTVSDSGPVNIGSLLIE